VNIIANTEFSVHSTAWRSDEDVVQALLKAGADVNAKNDEGQTPLIKFALYLSQIVSSQGQGEISPRLQVFKMLIDGGADVSLVDNKHRTALHAVAESRKHGQRPILLDVMKLLVEAGINVEAVDSDGATVFDILSDLQAQDLIDSLSRYALEGK
jgi:ankyrin repeat protein